MDLFASMADQKIRDAIAKGEFDDLPGKGKPLPPDDLEGVPDELRVGYRMLRNSGAIPPELELRKEMATLEDLLRCCRDEDERGRLRQKLTASQIRYREMMGTRSWQSSGAFDRYRERIEEKLLGEDTP